jgi:hypothetical protein
MIRKKTALEPCNRRPEFGYGISSGGVSPDVCRSKIPILIDDSDSIPKMNVDRIR